ncbi:MAG: hypothetical protein K6A23_11040 [Butyrivibrio sp.]|nr:hypothetical protein [Butyrivibrio sp.]
MGYDYLSSIVSNYTNLSSLTNKASSALNGVSSVSDAVSALSATNSFSSVLDAAIQSAGLNDDTASSLQSLAAVDTNSGLESEARSNLIMQNYLSAALMQDTLQNSLTDSADFTSSVFDNLAVGSNSEDGSSGSTLGALQENTMSAISYLSAYQNMLNKATDDESSAADVASSVGDVLENNLGMNNSLYGSDLISDSLEDIDSVSNDSGASNSVNELAQRIGLNNLSEEGILTGLYNISELANIYGLSGVSELSSLSSAV